MDDKIITTKIQKAMQAKPSFHAAQMAMSLMEYTLLDKGASPRATRTFCAKAKEFDVASVCVLPQYVRSVADQCRSKNIQITTVFNLPYGDKTNEGEIATIETIATDIKSAVANGADEISMVMDYKDFTEENARELLKAARQACNDGRVKMNVIIEVENGLATDWDSRCRLAVDCGADMIQTSTGQYPETMSDYEKMEAALVLIKHAKENNIGLKLSGGLNGDNYAGFLSLIEKEMGSTSLNPNIVRLGAETLMDDLRVTLVSTGQIKHSSVPQPMAF